MALLSYLAAEQRKTEIERVLLMPERAVLRSMLLSFSSRVMI